MKNEILSLLGLAMKAGKCVSGEFTVEKTVKDHKAKLVVIATDTSQASKKSYTVSQLHLNRSERQKNLK